MACKIADHCPDSRRDALIEEHVGDGTGSFDCAARSDRRIEAFGEQIGTEVTEHSGEIVLAEHTRLSWFHKLLFELSYGSDFFGIEIFFRSFLILAFVRWAGMDAILPMTCFYCTIHFGKPLGECISSYFGGLLLGIVVYNTRSIYGGLIVHLGIAWLMEIGGYMGNASS